MKAKVGFERMAATKGVDVLHYRADNSRFMDDVFINACIAYNQTVDLCGVAAHFQNGIAKSSIRFVQDILRSALLHAIHR